MNNALKIEFLKDIENKDFKKLKLLIREYVIYMQLKNKTQFADISGEKRTELIDIALNDFFKKSRCLILDFNDINEIEQEVKTLTDLTQNYVLNPNSNNLKTRYFILKDNNDVVGFMQGQITKNTSKNRIEGLRNFTYISPHYSGKIGNAIDFNNNQYDTFYSEAMYQCISNWFKDNNVTYEKISTGMNMSHHIASYIKLKKFIPVDKTDKTLFLEKDLNKVLYRRSLDKIYRLFDFNKSRSTYTTPEKILNIINSTPELVFLSLERKLGLLKSFLKEEEKEKYKYQLEILENKVNKIQDDYER